MRDVPLDALCTYVAVVEAGSISAAAAQLGVPRPTLSRQLAHLEEQAGVRLLHRTTRKQTCTAAGEALYLRARRLVADADEAWTSVRRQDDVPRGLLRVAIPPAIGQSVFGPMIVAYLARYPETQVEVVAASRHVDLVAERVDVAVRAGVVADTSLVARRLFSQRLLAYAAPAYLERHGEPTEAAALQQHQCILGFARGEVPQRSWPLWAGGAVSVAGRLATNDLPIAALACAAGQGIALLPDQLVAASVADGAVVPVLHDEVGATASLSIVYPSRTFLAPKVRAFVDLVAEAMPAALSALLRITDQDARADT